MGSRNKMMEIPEAAIDGYLAGRPRDPRVKYATLMPRGKMYRKAMGTLPPAPQPKVQVVDES